VRTKKPKTTASAKSGDLGKDDEAKLKGVVDATPDVLPEP